MFMVVGKQVSPPQLQQLVDELVDRTDDPRVPPIVRRGHDQIDEVLPHVRVGEFQRPGAQATQPLFSRSISQRFAELSPLRKLSPPAASKPCGLRNRAITSCPNTRMIPLSYAPLMRPWSSIT